MARTSIYNCSENNICKNVITQSVIQQQQQQILYYLDESVLCSGEFLFLRKTWKVSNWSRTLSTVDTFICHKYPFFFFHKVNRSRFRFSRYNCCPTREYYLGFQKFSSFNYPKWRLCNLCHVCVCHNRTNYEKQFMKVITEMRRVHYIGYLRIYFRQWCSTIQQIFTTRTAPRTWQSRSCLRTGTHL